MERWYVVQTHPRVEQRAAWHLCNQGFGAYLPQHLKRRRHARRTEWVRAPLFPGYLFVAMDIARMRWRAIASTIGVCRLVSDGERPTPVPVGIVEEIRVREDTNGLIRMDRQRPFKRGEVVQITSGPLADRAGLFECQVEEERVILLLELLGRQVKVKMPLEAIAACI